MGGMALALAGLSPPLLREIGDRIIRRFESRSAVLEITPEIVQQERAAAAAAAARSVVEEDTAAASLATQAASPTFEQQQRQAPSHCAITILPSTSAPELPHLEASSPTSEK